MKILLIVALHVVFPLKFKDIIKKVKIDLIISTGEFSDFDDDRKIVISNISKTKSFGNKVKDNVKKENYKKMINKIIKSMEKPLKIGRAHV